MPKFDPKLIAQWTGGKWKFGIPHLINGISTDTRTISKDNLFVALKGVHYDAHNFVQEAFAKGAAGAVVAYEPKQLLASHPLLYTQNTLNALTDIAACYRKEIGAKVIAITGSLGKTTVKEMVADILSTQLATARTVGNWNNEIGVPLSVLKMLPSTSVGVFEVGTNHPGELMPLCRKLAPDCGIITTIAPVHLEFFESVKAIVMEKAELLKCLPADGTAILKKDDYYNMLRLMCPCKVCSIALNGEADYSCVDESLSAGNITVLERLTGDRFAFKPPLPGRHMLTNALFAVAAARTHGLGWDEIRHPLEQYKTLPMRWESIYFKGILIVNDAYNANPVSMDAALQTFGEINMTGKKWLVLAGMHELGKAETRAHINLGRRIAADKFAGLITVGSLGALISDSALKAGMNLQNIFKCKKPREAAEVLSQIISEGDAVLLKGSRAERMEEVLRIFRKQV